MEFQTWFKRGWLKGMKALLLYRQLWVSAAAQKHRGEVRSPQTGTQSCHLQPGLGWAGTAQLGCCCRVGRVWQAVLQPVCMTGLLVSLYILPLAVLLCSPFREGRLFCATGNAGGMSCPCSPAPALETPAAFWAPLGCSLGFGCSG